MSDILLQSKARINEKLAEIEEATGKEHPTLSDGIQTLIDGYGQGDNTPENAIYKILEYAENGYPKKIQYQAPQGLDETTVHAMAFGNTTNNNSRFMQAIEEVVVSENVVNLGGNAFNNCWALKRFSNYDNLININNAAFNACKLEYKYLPPKVEVIGNNAFANMSLNISPLIIPETVNSIGSRVFYNSFFTTIMFKGKPETLVSDTLLYTRTTDIYVPWAEGEVSGAPWGATSSQIHYNTTYDENGNPIVEEV